MQWLETHNSLIPKQQKFFLSRVCTSLPFTFLTDRQKRCELWGLMSVDGGYEVTGEDRSTPALHRRHPPWPSPGPAQAQLLRHCRERERERSNQSHKAIAFIWGSTTVRSNQATQWIMWSNFGGFWKIWKLERNRKLSWITFFVADFNPISSLM